MIRRLFSGTPVPQPYRSNFNHLYWDIGWFGVLSGSAANFLGVYAARLGATGFQIGLLGSMGAVISLLIALPAARWIERRRIDRVVFWTSIAYRLFYLLWIPLPWLLDAQGQIWALIVIALLMGIPGVPLGVGFNILFASAVPEDWRAHVAGIRNVVFSIVFILSSLASGYLLDHLPFPVGYQLVFGIGAFGALMSSYHLYFIRPLERSNAPLPKTDAFALEKRTTLRLDVWKSPFGRVLLVLLAFHLAQYLAIPLFPLYNVNVLKLTDAQIGIGTALFYLTVLLGSTQLARLARRFGHHRLTAWGVMAMSLYPTILAFSRSVFPYYALQILGGLVWSVVGGAQPNYLLERVPADDRPAHLAWYSIVVNGCVLFGSLVGAAIGGWIGLGTALLVFGLLRLLAGLAIWKWG
ncbi:MAG: MFS transporter [Anaerolineales bacterium]|nr:MFS transporter [Anaerolineales bacterium]MDW8226545.1 MFS transporter [Anaerolineales bacterium]